MSITMVNRFFGERREDTTEKRDKREQNNIVRVFGENVEGWRRFHKNTVYARLGCLVCSVCLGCSGCFGCLGCLGCLGCSGCGVVEGVGVEVLRFFFGFRVHQQSSAMTQLNCWEWRAMCLPN